MPDFQVSWEWLWLSRAILQYAALAGLLLLALWRGAGPERACAGIIFAMVPLDRIYHFLAGSAGDYLSIDLVHFAIDAAAFAGLLAVMLQANRVYPIWLAAAQLISMVGHYARLQMPSIDESAYAIMARMPSYVQLLALAVGLGCHMYRRRRLGSYPSWRSSFAPTPATMQRPQPGN